MSIVYFVTLKSKPGRNLLGKIRSALDLLEEEKSIISKNDLVAVKVHFGEWGNLSYVRPQFAALVVDYVKSKGGKPFLTDSNTLYAGTRSCAVDHVMTAIRNGFGPEVTGAPVIIADGLRGESKVRMKVDGLSLKEVVLAAQIVSADALIVISHFKGHELTGFGGAVKNLGMGCAAREGKLFMHSTVSPRIRRTKCTGCGSCVRVCPAEAINIKGGKAVKVGKKCVGCADCIVACPERAVEIDWSEASESVMTKVAEYAFAVASGKKGKMLFLNFITQISPHCDCYGFNDEPIAPDVGICISHDPVAVDQASVDLVIKRSLGVDPFRKTHPDIDWQKQLEHAQAIGIGSCKYELRVIE